MYTIFFLLIGRLPKSNICKVSLGSALYFFHYNIIHLFKFESVHGRGNVSSTSLLLSDCVSVLLDVFFLFCEAFSLSAAVLSRAALTGCSSVSLSLWVSVSALSSPPLLSFRHYQTKAYFKTFWTRYISLIPFYSSLPCLLSSLPVFYFPSA